MPRCSVDACLATVDSESHLCPLKGRLIASWSTTKIGDVSAGETADYADPECRIHAFDALRDHAKNAAHFIDIEGG